MIPIEQFKVGQIWRETPENAPASCYEVVGIDKERQRVRIFWLESTLSMEFACNAFHHTRDELLTPTEVADLRLAK